MALSPWSLHGKRHGWNLKMTSIFRPGMKIKLPKSKIDVIKLKYKNYFRVFLRTNPQVYLAQVYTTCALLSDSHWDSGSGAPEIPSSWASYWGCTVTGRRETSTRWARIFAKEMRSQCTQLYLSLLIPSVKKGFQVHPLGRLSFSPIFQSF